MLLHVLIEINGSFAHIGDIETLPGIGEQFTYSPSWIESDNPPLSASLPLRREAFSAREMKPYFEGLLPEESARKAAARAAGVSAESYIKLLQALAGECIGAVSVVEDGIEQASASYRAISSRELQGLATSGYGTASELSNASRLSLAGAQAKTGLYQKRGTNEWYLPLGSAPSTHIVKPQNASFPSLIENELFCMQLAQRCGIATADTKIAAFGEATLLTSARYDRAFSKQGATIDGLPAPHRLHQEDFCQALGIPSAEKYEERGLRYAALAFQLVREHSSSPVADQQALLERLLFNYFIGNCDAHLKNYSLLRSPGLEETQLAPAYDLVSTTVYPGLTTKLGMSIGTAKREEDVDAHAIEALAREVHISPKGALTVAHDLRDRVMDCMSNVESSCATTEHIKEQTLKRASSFGKGDGHAL